MIEGAVGAENAGDIALDDLTVLDEICETITRQGEQTKLISRSLIDSFYVRVKKIVGLFVLKLNIYKLQLANLQ